NASRRTTPRSSSAPMRISLGGAPERDGARRSPTAPSHLEAFFHFRLFMGAVHLSSNSGAIGSGIQGQKLRRSIGNPCERGALEERGPDQLAAKPFSRV